MAPTKRTAAASSPRRAGSPSLRRAGSPTLRRAGGPSPNQIAAEAIVGGTVREIAGKYRLSRMAVQRMLAKMGRRVPRRRAVVLSTEQIRLLDQLLAEQGLRKADVARLAGVSKQTVARWIRMLPAPQAATSGPTRCEGCGHRVARRPCPICEARKGG